MVMENQQITLATFGNSPNSSDLYTASKAKWILVSTTKANVYLDEKATGQTKFSGTQVAGTSVPAVEVQPSFFPVATKGAECGALCEGLSWADNNLESGYEFVLLGTINAKVTYFVSGVLNSTQTLANDPFGAAGQRDGFLSGSCWEGAYMPGQNPYMQ